MRLEGKRVHFVGIGGIGMSAIAQIAAEQGAAVDGCDLKSGGCVQTLIDRGYRCLTGHSEEHVADADVVVYSSAVPQDCAELIRARELGLMVLSRSHMLSHLMRDHKSISVVGSHGKTTTTWIISHMFIQSGLDPTVMLGGNVSSMDGNFRRGSGTWFVSEIDESDGLPEGISSFCTVLTNIDNEHTRSYGSVENTKKAFRRFLRDTLTSGTIVVCADDKSSSEASASVRPDVMTYGLSDGATVRADNVTFDEDGSVFDVVLEGRTIHGFTTNLPGVHNVRNTLASICVGLVAGVPIEKIKESLATCPRVERRFHVRKAAEVTVIDDYGHHPTEIKATLETIKASYDGRLLCIFQPHRYTRTQDLMAEFGTCFSDADMVYVMPIYPANESPIPGVTSQEVADSIARGSSVEVRTLGTKEILESVTEESGSFSVFVFMGAGNIVEAADEAVERLKQYRGA